MILLKIGIKNSPKMRFKKSNRSPFILKLTKKRKECPLEQFNDQCFAITQKLSTIRECIDTSRFPTEEIKELVLSLQKLKTIKIPQIRIPYSILQILEKKNLKEFFEEEMLQVKIKKIQKTEMNRRESAFLEELDKMNLEIQ